MSVFAVSQAKSQITVESGSSAIFDFSPHLNPQTGELEYLFDGVSVNLSLTPHVPLVVPVSFHQTVSNAWSNPLNWGGYLLAVDAAQLAVSVRGGPSLLALPGVYDTLKNGGPTEKSVSSEIKKFRSQWLPGGELSINGSLDVKFDVTIPGGKSVNMDQSPIILESLTINSGANVTANTSLTTRHDFVNHGFVTGLGAAVEGNFINDGTVSVSGSLGLSGTFNNTGTLNFQSNSSFGRPGPISNHGTIGLNGATLSGYAINEYSLLRGWGTLNTDLNEYSTLSADVSGQTLNIGGQTGAPTVTNTGTLKATNGGTLRFGSATVNQSGGGEISADNGVVDFYYANINNGTINASGSGYAQVSYSCVMTNVTNNAPMRLLSNFSAGTTAYGSFFQNNSTITVNYGTGAGQSAHTLGFGENTDLTGSGTIFLNNGTLNGGPVEVSSGQLIRGWGKIGASMSISNAIVADVAGQALSIGGQIGSPTVTNTGTLQATSGGTLRFGSATVNQSGGGSISADNGVVDFYYANINNGTINASGSGYAQVSYSCVMTNVTNNAPMRLLSNFSAGTTAYGSFFQNNSTITVNYGTGAGQSAHTLGFGENTNLNGTGTIFLNNGNLNGGPINISAGQLIRGWGSIRANLNEFGVLDADVPNELLNITCTAINNHNLIRASNGGSLYIDGPTITQDSSAAMLADNGVIDLYNASIIGGSLKAMNGGYFNSSKFCRLTNVTNFAPIRVLPTFASSIQISGGSLVNNGHIVVGFGLTGSNPYPSLNFTAATSISGTGRIALNYSNITGSQVTQGPGHHLSGVGAVNVPLVNHGTISPGGGVGTLTFTSPLSLQPTSNLVFELSGTTQGSGYDHLTALAANGSLVLSGKLTVVVLKPFQAVLRSSDSFRIIQCSGGLSGSFSNVVSGSRLNTNFGNCLVTIDATGVTLSDFRDGQTWTDTYFTSAEQQNPLVSGDMADPNSNGISNLLEYAMGADPKSLSSTSLPTSQIESGFVCLTYRRANGASDVSLVVEETTNLVSWATATVIEETLSDDGTIRIVKAKVPIGDAARKFLRLKATRQ